MARDTHSVSGPVGVLNDLAERVQHLGLIVHHEDTAVARHGYRRR
jgi:hypothetical protein